MFNVDFLKPIDLQQVHQGRQLHVQQELFANHRRHQVDKHRDPDLALERIDRDAKEVVNAQILRGPFKESLCLPALLVDLRNREGWQIQSVGEIDQRVYAVVVTNRDYATKNSDLVAKYLVVITRSANWIKDNPQKGQALSIRVASKEPASLVDASFLKCLNDNPALSKTAMPR